jgi:23S rRNA (adenine2503-C2)-methyltransferase
MIPELLALDPNALSERLGGSGRARAVYAALRRGEDPFSAGVLADGARERLSVACRPTAIERRTSVRAEDGTVKLLLELSDGARIEVVLIPEKSRTTLCVSSQVGCARGCRFCLTATMGLVRDLESSEIAAQVVAGIERARALRMPPLRNVVFMGMGEPLDNLDPVRSALELITGPLGFGPGHVTVSTVGPSPRAVLAAKDLPGRLAWSLHAPTTRERRALIPTQRHSIEALRDAFAEVVRARREPLFVEVTLIDGVNDRLQDAARIAALFQGFGAELRFNLLPMNAIGASDLAPSSPERVLTFQRALIAAGYFTKVRKARGADARSACGQLAILDAPRKSRCT